MFSTKSDAEKKKEEKEKKKEQEKKEAEKKKKEEEEKKKKEKEKDEPKDVGSLFPYYAAFGDSASEGEGILAKNVKKWLKQAEVLDDKPPRAGITEEEVQAAFDKVAKGKERLDKSMFKDFLTTLCDDTKIGKKEMESKLVEAGKPRVTNVKDLASKMMG